MYHKNLRVHPPLKMPNWTDHGGSTLRFWWKIFNKHYCMSPPKKCLLEKKQLLQQTNYVSTSVPPNKKRKQLLDKTTCHKLSAPKSPATLYRLCTTTTDGWRSDPSRRGAARLGTIAGSLRDWHSGWTLAAGKLTAGTQQLVVWVDGSPFP